MCQVEPLRLYNQVTVRAWVAFACTPVSGSGTVEAARDEDEDGEDEDEDDEG